MPSFGNAWRWERLEPELGDNRSLPVAQRFFLEVASGLSKLQVAQVFQKLVEISTDRQVADKTDDQVITEYAVDLAGLFGPYVRMGKVPLKVGISDVKTLADYFGIALRQEGQPLATEIFTAVRTANTWEGAQELFSVRHSGGFTFTGEPSAEPDESPKAGR